MPPATDSQAEDQPRRRLSAEKRRESILGAANQVFGERGYEHVRIDDIAAAAGISKALIYEHFRSKSELYIELMNRAAVELGKRLVGAAAAPGVTGSGRLEGAAFELFAFVDEQPDSFHMFVRDVTDPEIASQQDALRGGFVSAMADIMEMEPPEKRVGLGRDQTMQLGAMVVAGAYALAEWALQNPKTDRRELAAMMCSFMWLGLGRIQDGERWELDQAPVAGKPAGQ
jgi:AcrR family transcriptional regulator